MTDKVQKIREEVQRLQNELIQEKEKGFGSDTDDACILELQNVLTYIDSLQEEPKPKFKVGDCIKPIDSCLGPQRTICEVCDSWYVTNQGTLDFEYEDNWELVEEPSIPDIVDKHWFEMLDEEPILEVLTKYLDHVSRKEAMKTKGAIDRWFDDYYPEPVSEWHDASNEYPFPGKEIIVLRDNKIYYGKYIGGYHRYVRAEIQLTDDTAHTYAIIDYLAEKDKWIYVEDLLKLANFAKTCKNWKEPVGEELEEAARKYADNGECKDTLEELGIKCAFKAGAKWQKERDEDEIQTIRELLDNFDKTCDEYHDAGFKHGQEALMKDAVESDITGHCEGWLYFGPVPECDFDFKNGDKVKLIIIKED